ncbi:Protein of unknown function DUF131 [Pyrobaculum oguniense TE7]|uniref:Uncharacterized protein n=1 Tax=Pyrobaculum oguniense (strain DSM 13380 / JCM 10595 / TE7) TaxID=698757 RepID=H6QAZ4_PYROT|nr:Protein of unknown function DUF131 [Pyrobaculum oguniense TE7]
MLKLVAVGLALILLGFALLVAGVLSTAAKGVPATGGAVGCVLIFFVPICFGGGSQEAVSIGMAVAAVLIMAAAALQWLLLRRGAS